MDKRSPDETKKIYHIMAAFAVRFRLYRRKENRLLGMISSKKRR
jgi:hypothetical protein